MKRFDEIPQFILNCFSSEKGLFDERIEGISKICFVLVDAFGWVFWERFKEESTALRELYSNGRVLKIQSQFPSTTAAHVTTLHSGLPVGQTGIYEWVIYEPMLDDLIHPLPYCRTSKARQDALFFEGIPPEKVFSHGIFYPRLKEKEIESVSILPAEYANSVFNGFYRSDVRFGYRTLSEAFSLADKVLTESSKKTFLSLYYPQIDMAGHQYGPDSSVFKKAVNNFFDPFGKFISSLPEDTLLILTADHGQVPQDLRKRIWLNREMPWLSDSIKRTRDGGRPLVSGSARDVFLHILPDRIEESFEKLKETLKGRAEVLKTASLMETGAFGGDVSDRLRARIGDILILPERELSAWWAITGEEQMFLGHHGGRTSEECEIPFVLYRR